MIKVWLFTLLIVLFTISHIQCATNQSTIASMNNCRDWIPITFFFQAKQRASIKWLLSKAYDHRTPEELREPFYKDHDVSSFFYFSCFANGTKKLKGWMKKLFTGVLNKWPKKRKESELYFMRKANFLFRLSSHCYHSGLKITKNVSFASFYTLTEITTLIFGNAKIKRTFRDLL